MSLKIIKKGLLDTIQDGGREGYRGQGIRPCGAMDKFSASLANALLGKDLGEPVLEMHFPAASIQFTQPAIIALTGAEFSPQIDGRSVPLFQPLQVPAGAVLSFAGPVNGQRCYLSVFPGLRTMDWLGSSSADTRSGVEGLAGIALSKWDEVFLRTETLKPTKDLRLLPWKVNQAWKTGNIRIMAGPEWDYLTKEGRDDLLDQAFRISPLSDRMGYRLEAKPLAMKDAAELISSAVEAGTIQCLPGGQLVVLMADHPTTGGYPRVATLVSAELGRLAQQGPGSSVRFSIASQQEAEDLYISQWQYLQEVKKMGGAEMHDHLSRR